VDYLVLLETQSERLSIVPEMLLGRPLMELAILLGTSYVYAFGYIMVVNADAVNRKTTNGVADTAGKTTRGVGNTAEGVTNTAGGLVGGATGGKQ